MESALRQVARGHNLPFIRDYHVLPIKDEEYVDDKIFRLVDRFASIYGGSLVLYGGLTASERIFGFKRIRTVSNDLDFVCTPEGVEAALARERPFYHEDFDVLFAIVDNIPVSFSFAHIHDWRISEDFFASSLFVQAGSEPIRCSSREYAIMLKLRRMDCLASQGKHLFGKDALDIINMLTAPCFKKELPPVALERLCSLVKAEVTANTGRLRALADFIAAHGMHLTAKENDAFLPVFTDFETRLIPRGPYLAGGT